MGCCSALTRLTATICGTVAAARMHMRMCYLHLHMRIYGFKTTQHNNHSGPPKKWGFLWCLHSTASQGSFSHPKAHPCKGQRHIELHLHLPAARGSPNECTSQHTKHRLVS
ncbi:hypothetical protein B0T24DRAFT_632795 [Lasiosphaeria ovina]|uniref:Uncharacterized protein n=1 Tax=Lasiosphaeria ovina TaxID=92902 RepID=A0AAE0K412_9PEZI|nr:hypothetical protein B0T24DRAFT_632795 [Lasiosphaeria ovina]